MRNVWPLIFLTLLLPMCSCDPGKSIRGHVRDLTGKALPDATVRLSIKDFSQRSVTTAADGSYSIGMLHPPNVEETLTVDKPGYLEAFANISSGAISLTSWMSS